MVLTRLGGQQTSLGILKLVFSVDNWPFLVNDSLAETIYFSFLKGWWVETRESERHFQRGATKTLQQDFGWNARGPQSLLRREDESGEDLEGKRRFRDLDNDVMVSFYIQ